MTVATAKATCPATGVEAATHFLSYWFQRCDGLAELRYRIIPDGPMLQEWFALDRLDNMAMHAVSLSTQGGEVYFGVCTRSHRKGTKDAVCMVPGFFVDLDFPSFDGGGIEALERLDRFSPPPTNIVHTGNGLHVYWKLTTPLFPDPKAQAFVKAVAREVGGDRAATDLSRCLRVPGCWSFKNDACVRLIRCCA